MRYANSIPYPKIQVEKRNPDYAKMLMHVYAGEVSEETAIHLYIYQSILLKEDNPELAKIILEIAKVEMRHLDILGTLIKKLGVYPMYMDPCFGKKEFWNASYIPYNPEVKDMLKINIQEEQQAILDYNELIEVIHDFNIQNILKRIILDEEIHIEIFEKYLQTLCN